MRLLINFYWQVINLCQKCIYDNQDLLIVLVDHLQKIKKGLKSLCKVVIRILFTKMNLIKHVFNMIWPMVNQLKNSS